MTRPRTTKLFRDFWTARGRVAVMVVAISVALTGMGALLVTRAVVLREAAAAYAATNPASATLDVAGGVDAGLLDQVRNRPGIADAAARQVVRTRVRVDGQWRPMLLFVVGADDPLRIARFRVESGVWPSPDDGLLIERAAGSVLDATVGDRIEIAGPRGGVSGLAVTGTTYDAALAPAPQERTGYGYVTPAALARLGFAPVAEQLKIVVTDPADPRAVDATARELATWLTAGGHEVHQIEAPPHRHPHQKQTNTITGLFLAFAMATLVLAGVLIAATLGGLLAAQTRQIGVMKTIGATTGQLLRMYVGATLVIAFVATALAIGPALLAGQGLVSLIADLLNIDVTSRALPLWVYVTFVAAGIGTPVLVALSPLSRAARITVRAALDDHGVNSQVGARRGVAWRTRLRGNRTFLLAARNLLRRRARLSLTVGLLAAGGALFTTGLNTATAWQAWVDDGLARRAYDAELQFAAPAPASQLAAVVGGVDGVTAIETVASVPAAPARADGQVEVERTYPDGGHGRFTLVGLPADTTMIDLEILDGRWLQDQDTHAVVLNQAAADRLGNPKVGSDIRLAVEGQVGRWQLVGTVAEIATPATAYTVPAALAPHVGPDQATAVRVSIDGDPQTVTTQIEAALTNANLPANDTILTSQFRGAVEGHVTIFINTLLTLAGLMAVVGVLGLASTMSIAVTERTREYGIMQAVGASRAAVRRVVLTEGVLAGALGCLLAIALGIPLSAVVGRVLGQLSFGLPLPTELSTGGLIAWLLLAVLGAAAATLAAASRAARLTIRETLAYQ